MGRKELFVSFLLTATPLHAFFPAAVNTQTANRAGSRPFWPSRDVYGSYTLPLAFSTRLQYRDDKQVDMDNDQQHQPQQQQQQPLPQQQQQQQHEQPKPPKRPVLTIPILGPFPNQNPLLLNAELSLNPPTPMQWLALEEAVLSHQKHGDADPVTANIDAAPLVAILDDSTSSNIVLGSGRSKITGRYATLVAVTGMTTQDDNDDDDDTSSFMESLRSSRAEKQSIVNRRVRLVAVGRALIHNLFYQVPTFIRDAVDDQGHLVTPRDEVTDDPEEPDDEVVPATNIVMAHFRLLSDHGAPPANNAPASPVHAIAHMSSLANKLHLLHQQRQKIVAGMQAGKARLELRDQRVRQEALLQQARVEELFDYDGIGALFADTEWAITEPFENEHASTPALATVEAVTDDESSEPSFVARLENYGMGFSSSAISSIPDLTKAALDKLAPYYSPDCNTSEEHYYEVLSFVAISTMDQYLEAPHFGWAVSCTNTIERLQAAYEWMSCHVELLEDEARRVSQQLLECGEECTDLF